MFLICLWILSFHPNRLIYIYSFIWSNLRWDVLRHSSGISLRKCLTLLSRSLQNHRNQNIVISYLLAIACLDKDNNLVKFIPLLHSLQDQNTTHTLQMWIMKWALLPLCCKHTDVLQQIIPSLLATYCLKSFLLVWWKVSRFITQKSHTVFIKSTSFTELCL